MRGAHDPTDLKEMDFCRNVSHIAIDIDKSLHLNSIPFKKSNLRLVAVGCTQVSRKEKRSSSITLCLFQCCTPMKI